jgi:hypothetical protein
MTFVVQKLIACNRSLSLNFKFDVRWVVQVVFKPGSRGESRAPLESWQSGRLHFFAKEEDVKVPQVQILPVPPVSRETRNFVWGGSSVVEQEFRARESDFLKTNFPSAHLARIKRC